jgi:TfoX/Sxy family transcriptional regulator of competence genes
MASQQSIADYIVEQLAASGVTARKMFGEYGVFADGKMVALICDDQLYVKPTEAGRAFLGPCPEGQPYPRSKPHFLIAAERWDDSEWLTKLITLTAAELPVPKKKPRKTRA